MLENRLRIILAERYLRVDKVAKDTGISRNTLTSLKQNKTKMIQLKTVDKLCQYLNVTPAEFFDYSRDKN